MKFPTKRMALLYIAKMNSESVLKYIAESGKKWPDLCKSSGVYAVSPNIPFDMDLFLELSDEQLDTYGAEVGNALNVHKAPQGTIFSCKPVSLTCVAAEELMDILKS